LYSLSGKVVVVTVSVKFKGVVVTFSFGKDVVVVVVLVTSLADDVDDDAEVFSNDVVLGGNDVDVRTVSRDVDGGAGLKVPAFGGTVTATISGSTTRETSTVPKTLSCIAVVTKVRISSWILLHFAITASSMTVAVMPA
jgi:hypothetical protein